MMVPVATVLVLDDDPATVLVLSELLARLGHKVLRATDLQDALDMAKDSAPSLAIVDYHLEDGSTGIDFIKKARQHPPNARMPVIMISAQPPQRFANEIAGVARFMLLLKPVGKDALGTAVQDMLDPRP